MSATPDSTLANPEQRIADLERQLAECKTELAEYKAERDEALEQQTATAEILQAINSSPGDLGPVFDSMLEKATSLCDASFGILWNFAGDLAAAGALHQVPEAYAALCRAPFRPSPGSGPALMMRGERGFALTDLAEYPPYLAGDALARAIVDLAGARSVVIEPLRKDTTTLGAITLYRQEVRPFTDKQIALLQNFAAQAVIAMENARLITETREALEQQTATAEVLGVINSSPGDLAPVFDAILDKAHALCGVALGELELYENRKVHAVAVRGVTGTFADLLRQPFALPPGSPPARLLAGEAVVQITDVAELAREQPDDPRAQAGTQHGLRTALFVPLRKDGVLLGYITGYRREVRPFSEREITLLQNFAAQAVIAIDNTRLIIETREALEQQTATAEVLGVINSSPGNLAPVFDAMLERATRLCEGVQGVLWRIEGGRVKLAATHQLAPGFVEMLRRIESGELDIPPQLRQIMQGDRLVHVADMAEHELYRADDSRAKAAVNLGHVRTLVWVALVKDDAPVGAFAIARREVRPFTDKQIALLQNFAAQAVIAMENARLITETREALEQQTATAEVLGVINSSPGDLTPVFDAILEKAHTLCGAAHGTLMTYDGELFRAAALHDIAEPLASWLRQPFRSTPGDLRERLLRGERLIHIHDIATPEQHRNPEHQAALDAGVRTLLIVPLRKDHALLGYITAANHREVRPFTDKQIALLQNFAAQAVIAMENARLITETREALEQQTATAEVLGVINSSPGDLGPVFDALLEKATRVCDGAFGVLTKVSGGLATHLAYSGPVEFGQFFIKHAPVRPGPGTSMARLLEGAGVVHIPDASEEEVYHKGDPARRAMVDLAKARTLLSVPLRKDDTVLGALHIYRQEVRPFTEKQIDLLQNFAAQAVIAMENARLLGELRQRTEEVAELNRGLEARVAEQVDELGRVGRLKRFLAPQLAEMIVSHGDEKILESHRREIVVVFCDLRGYTAFTETAEPEEVLDFLREYHGALGPLVSQYEGTLDQFSGDGIMVFFNDPVPIPDPAERAVKMAVAMREGASKLIAAWRRHGSELGFGAGIAQGYATLGQIGFSDRSGYTAIGTVCNLAARLCAEAKDGQILVSSRIAEAVGAIARLEDLGNLELKGLRRPVAAFNVTQSTGAADARPNLTVVATEPGA